jgi:hypothetical protein
MRASQATAETWVLPRTARTAVQKISLSAFALSPTEVDSAFHAISHVHTLAPMRLNYRFDDPTAVPLLSAPRSPSLEDNTSNAKLLVLPRRRA